MRWSRPGGGSLFPSRGRSTGSTSGTLHLRATAFGRAWTYRDTMGTGVVRVSLDPGVLVRESTIPGVVDASLEQSDRPEWVARIDPAIL